MKQTLKSAYTIIILTVLVACGMATPMPTVMVIVTPTLNLTPFIPSITLTATPSPTSIPTATTDFCNSAQWPDKIEVISGLRFTALESGDPTLFDHILVEQNPTWANFRQSHHGEMMSAGVIFHETGFGPELGTGINPAVLLVTYGVEQNWELPANSDLVLEVEHIRAVLFQHRS